MTPNVKNIVETLAKEFPNPKAPLNARNMYEFTIAVLLSAQCTDERVNKITPLLFAAAPTPQAMLELGQEKVAEIIKPCGLFNNKSKNIISLSRDVLEKYNGEIPGDFEKLQNLAGVGRKTALVVMSQGFGEPTFPVDTHIFRICNRLGLTKAKNVLQTEKQVTKKVPKKYWNDFHLQIIFHGRKTCKARKPLCGECKIAKWCKKVGVEY